MVMITKHVRCNVLTAKSINNFKHRNNYPFIEVGYFSSHFSIKQCKMPDFCIVFITDSPEREKTQTFCRAQIFVLLFTHQLQDKIFMINIIIKAPPGFPTFISEY